MENAKESPRDIALKILEQNLEGKSLEFIKQVCREILTVFDSEKLSRNLIEDYANHIQAVKETETLCLQVGVLPIH
jgi:hypothetical protein